MLAKQDVNQGSSKVLWVAVWRYLCNRWPRLILSWKRSDYLLGITDVKIPWCETKSIIFFLHAFSCKQRCRRHHEWYSSLWQKVVKKGPIFSTFFPNKRRWEQDCKIPSWPQRCFKKSFFPLKKPYFSS